jgi:hypothetical protein
MAATTHFSPDSPLEFRDSVEERHQALRDLESKLSELREMQASPDGYRASETSDLEIRKRALQDEITQLEAHPPRLFKGKHKLRIEDLRIDMNYLDSQIAKIASDRANYMSSLASQIDETEAELELARRELGDQQPKNRGLKIHKPENREAESHEPENHTFETPGDDTFYRETMAPALLALIEARRDEDRLRFLDGYREATTLLGRRQLEGLDDEAQQKTRILYDYVLGYPCMDWFPGDPALLLADLRDRARAWNASVDSNDAPFELALAYGLMIVPRQVMSKLEHSPKAGDVRHRMKQIEEACPGALEISERKCIHVMRIADTDWLRKLAEQGLDRINQIRR